MTHLDIFRDISIGVTSILCTILALFCYQCLKFIFSKEYALINKLPGPKTQLLFGNVLQFIGKREDAFSISDRIVQKFADKPIIRLWFFNSPRLLITKAQAAEVLLSSSRLLDKNIDYRFLHKWLGLGLLTRLKIVLKNYGWTWIKRRNIELTRAPVTRDFATIMSEQTVILMSLLKQFDGKGYFDVYPFLTRFTLDIICAPYALQLATEVTFIRDSCSKLNQHNYSRKTISTIIHGLFPYFLTETAMGRSIKAQTNTESDYVTAVNSMGEIVCHRAARPWIHPEILFQLSSYGKQQRKNLKVLHAFTNKVIIDKRKEMRGHTENGKDNDHQVNKDLVFGQKQRLAFLDMLLEGTIDGKPLTNEDVREEVDTFMFEGHDTTASGLNWILFNIGRFPDIQEKVFAEIESIVGDSAESITDEDVKEMKYLECVIKETFRLFPPVPFYGRSLNEDTNICGYLVPADVSVMICCNRIHRDPEFFPDPLKFDPDRFLPDNMANRHPYAYIPFSAGPRNCIGQKFALLEEKIATANILRHYKITSRDNIDDMKLFAELILRPSEGLWIKIESRR